MHRRVLVALLEPVVLLNVVEVVLADDDGVLHLGRLDDARDELAADVAELDEGIERRIEYFCNLGDVGTSMLQDFQSGRTLELDPIVGSVREMGKMVDVPTPTIDTIYALARKKAEIKGLYQPLTIKF